MTLNQKPDRMEAFRLAKLINKRGDILTHAEGKTLVAITDTCSMREGVCRKSLPNLAAERGDSLRQYRYGLHGRQRKDGSFYFIGLLKRGIVYIVAGGHPEDGVPTTYGINMDVLRSLANGTDTPAQTPAQTTAQIASNPGTNDNEPRHNGASNPGTNPGNSAAKVLSSSVKGSKNSSLGERESSESIPPAAVTKNQSLSPSPTSCEKSSTEKPPQEKTEQQYKQEALEEQRQWKIARDERIQKTMDEIETEAHRWCGRDKNGNEISDRPNFNQKGKDLIRQALVKIENHYYDENLREDGWPDDPINRGTELCFYDDGIKNIVKEAVESSDAFALKSFSTNLGSSLYGALNQMYEAREEAEMERRRKAAEKYIADFMQHVRDEDFGDAWVKMHPAPNKFSVIKEKINAAIKAERDRRAGEKASASA
jgi:hypothetical protein